jgi:hypothetical protein
MAEPNFLRSTLYLLQKLSQQLLEEKKSMTKLSKQSVPTYTQSTTSQTAAYPMSKPTEHIQPFKTDKPSDIRSILQQLS